MIEYTITITKVLEDFWFGGESHPDDVVLEVIKEDIEALLEGATYKVARKEPTP